MINQPENQNYFLHNIGLHNNSNYTYYDSYYLIKWNLTFGPKVYDVTQIWLIRVLFYRTSPTSLVLFNYNEVLIVGLHYFKI